MNIYYIVIPSLYIFTYIYLSTAEFMQCVYARTSHTRDYIRMMIMNTIQNNDNTNSDANISIILMIIITMIA